MTPSFMPPARSLTTLPALRASLPPDRSLLQTTAPSEVKRVFYAGSASATISGGPGTDLVYLAGSPSDWVADGQGTYVNRLNPSLRVMLRDVEVVRFYSADGPDAAPSRLSAQA